LTVVGRSSHALLLNGVSDGVVVPLADFTGSDLKLREASSSLPTLGSPVHGVKTSSHNSLKTLTIEAWVRPDCGGVVVSKAETFELKVGQVGEPGPAVFTLFMSNTEGPQIIELSTAYLDATPRWVGTTYPRHGSDLHASYNSNISGVNDATSLNFSHRELLHIVATLRGNIISLFINGSLAVQEVLPESGYRVKMSPGDFEIGGTGGEFRGAIEAIHIANSFNSQMLVGHGPIPLPTTLGLWRFEEPADVHPTIYQSGTFSAGPSVKTITITAASAQSIIEAITGNTYNSASPSVDLTASPYSNGNYKVVDYVSSPGTGNTIAIPHTPYNIMFNADAVNPLTKKPNQKPPERLRLLSVNGATGVLGVESIHLDFTIAGARRGVLCDRTTNVDDHFVLLSGDLLLDSGTGKPYQPPHYASQAIDRTGQMVIDESGNDMHGLIYASSMATTANTTDNPFAAVWPAALDTGFQIGHTGRHALSAVDGHHYLRQLPLANEEIVHQSIDGTADITEIYYDSNYRNLKDSLPPNSRVDIFRDTLKSQVMYVRNEGIAFQMVENGMAGIDDAQRKMLAIGGSGTQNHATTNVFDYQPFLLKNPLEGGVSNDDTAFRRHHLRPIETSRVAILSVPTLGTTHNLAPFVEIHYNAVDVTGASAGLTVGNVVSVSITSGGSGYSAGTAATTGGTGTGCTVTYTVSAGAINAVTAIATKGTDYTVGDILTVSGGGGNATLTVTSVGGPCLMVEKTVPSGEVVLSTGPTVRVLDVIAADLADAAKDTTLYSPGGIIRLDTTEATGNFPAGVTLETLFAADPHEGIDHEDILDESLSPANYTPLHSSDLPNANPTSVDAEHSLTQQDAVFNRLVMNNNNEDLIDQLTITDNYFKRNPSTVNSGVGAYDIGNVSESTHLFESYDIIGAFADKGKRKGITFLIHPTNRSRTNQLSKVASTTTHAQETNTVSVQYLMSRARAQSFSDTDGDERQFTLTCVGLMGDVASRSIDLLGAGAPDSHIVKEVMPGAPVVSVTLGGVGQGAVNTKPTFDPSPFTRLGWNTRRDCATQISVVGAAGGSTATLTVIPLNNDATDLASWGTYCFPKTGRIYLENGGSAEYQSKTGSTFVVDGTTTTGTNKFLNGDGSEAANYAAWLSANTIIAGTLLLVDDKFGDDSTCNDGSTINDRMFQRMDTVSHDYQLGSQYASTRALAEIPLFPHLFFEDRERCITPGPDNSLKLHIDATHTAHTWAPNPVGRRCPDNPPTDQTVHSVFSSNKALKALRKGTHITRTLLDNSGTLEIYVEEPEMFLASTTTATTFGGTPLGVRYFRAFLQNGEWMIYTTVDMVNKKLTIPANLQPAGFSKHFKDTHTVGMRLFPAPGLFDENVPAIRDHPNILSAAYERRRPYYYDRANVQTQGGNIDYGLRQYVSAVEFRAGPRENPHLPKTKTKRARAKVVSWDSGSNFLFLDSALEFPEAGIASKYMVGGAAQFMHRIAYIEAGGTERTAQYLGKQGGNQLLIYAPTIGAGWNPSAGTEVFVKAIENVSATAYPQEIEGPLNASWEHPYAAGGLRDGDTIWMNMHYTNPHAVEGLFCKSRGTFNEAKVSAHFNGGEGALASRPRDSIPLENFLIGNDCLETARNMAQHVNKTIELNWTELGRDDAVPVVAFVDPYQATETFARVLLYDVAHDREFVAMQDIHMQVQSSPATPKIGTGALHEDPDDTGSGFDGIATTTNYSTQLDVAAGFESEDKTLRPNTQSDFMESAFTHNSVWNSQLALATATASHIDHEHHTQDAGCLGDGSFPRTAESVCCPSQAATRHIDSQAPASPINEYATFFDTPEGTRAIPAFLCLKGIRNQTLDLSNHRENRLQHLPHWTQMDFVRRLTIDCGEVGVKEGVTDIEAAAREIVRLINQGGALNGRTHARRPADQYPGESERLDLATIGPNPDAAHSDLDSSAPHLFADFSATGSTFDPAPFWDEEKSFSSYDRGTHMGYIRAHIGRVVEDSEGNEGYTVVIHSTIPGASGRNFCVWLDNARGQSSYRPEFLIGHGGRFRNFWCKPDEVLMENMHPAPMPINKDGRPFAPITTLNEYLPPEEPEDEFRNNLNYGLISTAGDPVTNANNEAVMGRVQNTVYHDSFEGQSPDSVLTEGLRMGTHSHARINFGGLVATGVPGFSPDAGQWGMGKNGNTRYIHTYGKNIAAATSVAYTSGTTGSRHVPAADVTDDAIGSTSELYGLRFTDHIGRTHTIRFIYSQFGEPFVNEDSLLPPTIDNEICIWIDDRDCAQGGFTIGRHMWGAGEVCGRLTGTSGNNWVGNEWRGYPSPASGIHVATASVSSTAVTMTFTEPYHTGSSLTNGDMLGYLGFPDSGVFQYSNGNTRTDTFSYTHRTHNSASGTHTFYGVSGDTSLLVNDRVITSRINWTTLLTDEVLAAAVDFAINMENPNSERLAETSFDCTNLRAADGKTLGEWGVSPTAIRVRAHSRNHEVMPLRCLFESTLGKDWGLNASNLDSELSDANITNGKRFATGYLPSTVLHITTRYRGTGGNTATPILVDTMNNAVDTEIWKENLRGTRYLSDPGDLILPKIENVTIEIDQATIDTSATPRTMTVAAGLQLWRLLVPASNDTDSWSEKKKVWLDDQDWAVVETTNRVHATFPSRTELVWPSTNDAAISPDWNTKIEAFDAANINPVLSAYALPAEVLQFDGLRLKGSEYGEPLVYFRGGRDSPDHSVPVYFGGGFSGVVLDINDGTANDYSDFYTHPYAKGPTGSAGLQNIGEKSTSYCLLDCAAILAMFPGTPFLDDHKGSNNPPYFNQDTILSQDTDAGNNASAASTGITYASGGNTVNCTRPSPVILRFGHQHARYSPTGDGGGKTTYIIFGPGQAFPHNTASVQPQPSDIVTTGNGWSSVPAPNVFLPNEISHGDSTSRSGFNANLPPTREFQRGNVQGWNYETNWEPAHGSPNVISADNSAAPGTKFGYDQMPHNGLYYGSHYQNVASCTPPPYSHPFNYSPSLANAAIRRAGYIWHMDGGYHPGGHFLDNHILANPLHPIDNANIPHSTAGKKHPAGYRIGSLLASAYGATTQYSTEEYVIIDATRVQNAEELAAVLSCGINEWPGRDPLKALGGTFLPSFQSAKKQDRYGWVTFDTVADGYDEASGYIDVVNPYGGGSSTIPPIPRYGWIRTNKGGAGVTGYGAGATATCAPYNNVTAPSAGVLRFTLATNRSGAARLNETIADSGTDANETTVRGNVTKVYVWSKSSCQLFNNGRVTGSIISTATSQDHMCRVHFSGTVDAIDRTRPVGAVGWHGERYSYFNSLVLNNPSDASTNVFSAGLGAWHPYLGFSPYGSTSTCQGPVLPSKYDESTSSVIENDGCPQGLSPRHLVAVTYESEMALAAKADRNGTKAAGDWIYGKQGRSGASTNFGGTITVADQVYNLDRYVAPANGGPNVEAMFVTGQTQPTNGNAVDTTSWWHTRVTAAAHTSLSTPCSAPTGDLFWDDSKMNSNIMHADRDSLRTDCIQLNKVVSVTIINGGSNYNATETITMSNPTGGTALLLTISTVSGVKAVTGVTVTTAGSGYKVGDTLTQTATSGSGTNFTCRVTSVGDADTRPWEYWKNRSAGRNFNVEHVVWKRMDGGNLTMPASNTRGLGGVPRTTRLSAATGSITIVDKGGGATDINHLHNADGFVLTNTVGLAKEYVFDKTGTWGATGASHANGIVIQVNGMSAAADVANQVKAAILSANGHNGTIAATVASNVVSLEQRTPGTAGNVTIDPGSTATPSYITYSGMSGGGVHTMGETIYGNCRFSFETTNAAMFPIIQAQELAHPQLAEQHPIELRNILSIPNEEIQFQSVNVEDDTGQIHILEGGSPFGTVIRDFDHIGDRASEGLSPSLANSGLSPNMRIRLPNADSIPGNIIVRSGFDRVQSYQNETFGSGGMMHPAQPAQGVKDTFTNNNAPGPRAWPTWENKGWEHISQDAENIRTGVTSAPVGEGTRLAFPDSHSQGWTDHTNDNPLETAYEQHDRTLFFHVTRMGHTGSSREPVVISSSNTISDPLTYSSSDTNTVTAGSAPNDAVWKNTGEQTSDGRWFARVEDGTGSGAIFSYTNTSGSTFTGVVFDPDFSTFISGKTGLTIRPSWYIPAGSNRFFAARRMRDHSEMSGNSPDMKRWDWSAAGTPLNMITAPEMTPMPIPRMGHHYVTPTMAVMPGHFAHPYYERTFSNHYACRSSGHSPIDESGTESTIPGANPLVWFSTPTNALRPSDIHGGAFTLLTETKVAYDGYGIAASKGTPGAENATGRHILYLEPAGAYSLKPNFPDPMEVGAYQIVIQPNLHKQQLGGFHRNGGAAALPDGSVVELTGQQVNLVVGLDEDSSSPMGCVGLLLAEATMADTRGCEIFINEVMLDFEPDPGSQFANIPPLGLYNPLGVNENTSPPFSRRSLPYRAGTFDRATPGYTISVPWWSILHKSGATHATSTGFRHLEWHKPDDYYQFCRATYGSIGCQITLAGYPSIYLDIYEPHRRLRSLNPHCVVLADSSSSSITVDNNELFPVKPYYGEVLEYTDTSGVRQTASYVNRTGTLAHTIASGPSSFETVAEITAGFFPISAGTILKLSRAYDNFATGDVFKDSGTSAITRVLPQTLHGSRDTNSLHLGDAFLCLWHPNLGRPYTFYSDTGRTFYTNSGAIDAPQDKKALNHVPEHFETIHYHDFLYSISKGPFLFDMKAMDAANDGTVYDATGVTEADTIVAGGSGYTAGTAATSGGSGTGCTVTYTVSSGAVNGITAITVAGTGYVVGDVLTITGGGGNATIRVGALGAYPSTKQPQGDTSRHYAGFWPGGSRGGPAASRLDGYGYIKAGWGDNDYGMDCIPYAIHGSGSASGLARTAYGSLSDVHIRQTCFGYRFAVRPPYNRPRWSPSVRGIDEAAGSAAAAQLLSGYYHGPFVAQDDRAQGSGGWKENANAALSTADVAWSATATGILERQTQASAMLGNDQVMRQVRYSHGRRITRSFGCPVRTIRNGATMRKKFPGDDFALGKDELAEAHRFYLIDWWGNTRGEDVRRFPARGFGIRPAWDPEDAYLDGGYANEPGAQGLWHADGASYPSEQEGTTNTVNNGTMTKVDWYNPKKAQRIGDRGDGRGCRWPTAFNESLLHDISTPMAATGVVASHSTAEPPFSTGYMRASNSVQSSTETPRGISARLQVSQDGLLKPEANVSENIETISGTFTPGNETLADPISRSAPRIGLDTDTINELSGGQETDYIGLSTQAHSLHTDKEVGQRLSLRGAHNAGSVSLTHFDLTSPTWATQPDCAVLRVSNAHAMWALGGTYVLEARNYVKPFDDSNWGASGSSSSNPYSDSNHNPLASSGTQTNLRDKKIRFLLRPVRVLDNRHIELFRANSVISAGPSTNNDAYRSTAGGKYGLFNYEMPNARVGTVSPTNPPYAPSYTVNSASPTVTTSAGPLIPGADVTGFTGALDQTVGRILISENTLEHFRSDAPRRRAVTEDDTELTRPDYSIQPRHSQTLHPKGEAGTASYNTGDHSTE